MLNWIDHPSYRRDEQLMHLLFECGMATFQQLRVITGWSTRNLKWQIHRLHERRENGGRVRRQQEEKAKDSEPWLISHFLSRPYGKSRVAYSLGRPGIQYVHDMRQEENKKVKDPPVGQALHFIGTNEILVRCLKDMGRDRVNWLSTQAVTDLLLLSLKDKSDANPDRRNMIRPDARLTVDGSHFYIEFDNDTEMPRQLERKFHRYVQTLQPNRDTSPIVWITTHEKRKDYLQRNWEAIKRKYYSNFMPPSMYFFVQGTELSFFLQHAAETDRKQVHLHGF